MSEIDADAVQAARDMWSLLELTSYSDHSFADWQNLISEKGCSAEFAWRLFELGMSYEDIKNASQGLEVEQFALKLFDAGVPIDEISRVVKAKYPDRYPDEQIQS